MFSTFVTVALFLAPAIQGVLADFAINSPVLTQCGTSKISWEPTTGPYNLIVVKASEPCGDALVEIGDFTKTFVDWKTTLKAGEEVILSLVDSKDEEAWSKKITVGASNDSSCLTTTVAPTTTTSSGTTKPTGTNTNSTTGGSGTTDDGGDLTPLGAANVGNNPFSGAITARQASTPLLAVVGLVAVFALL